VQSIDDVRDALLEAFWTDQLKPLPGDHPEWVEVWLSSDEEPVIQQFRDLIQKLEIAEHEHRPLLRFPERSVLLLLANRTQLAQLIEFSENLAELRSARGAAGFFIELENRDQAEWTRELQGITTFDPNTDIAVCILDHGVNNQHPLLQPALSDADLHTVRPEWGTHDQHGHGTLMAGTALFGDLQAALESRKPVRITHILESAKNPPASSRTEPETFVGTHDRTRHQPAEIQAPARKRIICMAVTTPDERDRGKPTSWSAEVDSLASGAEDDRQRLIFDQCREYQS